MTISKSLQQRNDAQRSCLMGLCKPESSCNLNDFVKSQSWKGLTVVSGVLPKLGCSVLQISPGSITPAGLNTRAPSAVSQPTSNTSSSLNSMHNCLDPSKETSTNCAETVSSFSHEPQTSQALPLLTQQYIKATESCQGA